MPTVEDYIRLRRLGSAMQEMAEMHKAQGAFIEKAGNELINKENEDDDEDDEKEEGMPSEIKMRIISGLKKKDNTGLSGMPNMRKLMDRPEWPGSYFERSIMTF